MEPWREKRLSAVDFLDTISALHDALAPTPVFQACVVLVVVRNNRFKWLGYESIYSRPLAMRRVSNNQLMMMMIIY